MSGTFREGTLTSADATTADPEALGTISDIEDLLNKIDRMEATVAAAPGSLRAQFMADALGHARHLRAFLTSHSSIEARSALFHAMHASMLYIALLQELADDIPSVKQSSSDLTRAQYLEFRAKATSRDNLRELCDFKTIAALTKWEDRNNLPRPRQGHGDSESGDQVVQNE